MAGPCSRPSPRPEPPAAPAHPDWLFNRLLVQGEAAELAAFRAAAAGPGVVPWVLDYDRLEEGWFHLLLAPPRALRLISTEGARILARQLREAVWARHEAALARRDAACPFDLHRLLPVPPEILALGPDHPRALAWLVAHWGTTWPLRRVAQAGETPNSREEGHAEWRCVFWSADWTPWPAVLGLRAAWPGLRFEVRPEYDH